MVGFRDLVGVGIAPVSKKTAVNLTTFFTVLSQDRYLEYWDNYPEYRDVRWRIVRPTFVRGSMELPDDPYGIDGPTLENFLRK